jgi:hypothetical protein
MTRGALFCALFVAACLALPARSGRADDDAKPQDPAGEGGQEGEKGSEKGGGEKDEGEPPAPTGNPDVEKALRGLTGSPSLVGEEVTISYSFSRKSDKEALDWLWLKRPDRVALSEVNEGADGWSIGAGTRAFGKAVHKVEVGPPCSIEMDLIVDYNGQDSFLLATLCEPQPGKGIAVDWGRQLIRKGGKPVKAAGPLARADVKAGRNYQIRVEVKGGEVVASANGVETVRAALTEKEMLPGKIGLEIHDARVIFRSLMVQGKVSAEWAAKEAKKGKSKGK